MSGKIIFDNGKHQCIMFSDLVKGDGIQMKKLSARLLTQVVI
jgi:hypothetical protein